MAKLFKKTAALNTSGQEFMAQSYNLIAPTFIRFTEKMANTPAIEIELVLRKYFDSLFSKLISIEVQTSLLSRKERNEVVKKNRNLIKTVHDVRPKYIFGVVRMINNKGQITALGKLAITELNNEMFDYIYDQFESGRRASEIQRIINFNISLLAEEAQEGTEQDQKLFEMPQMAA